MTVLHVLTDFFSHPGVGVTIGIVVASGMIVGTSMVYLGMGWRQILGWALAFVVLISFVESLRLEIFIAHDQPYTLLPLFTIFLPFSFYLVWIVPGALIAKHYQQDDEEFMKALIREYEMEN